MGSINLLLLFLILFFHFANSSSDSGCIESERKALLEFKAGLVNDSSSLSSWTGVDCCSWDGITCHNLTGHVQELQLLGHNFNSPLSPWLFNLTHLEVLSMISSGFIGPIPNMFDKLTSLTNLDLSENRFNSSIPSSFKSLTNLTVRINDNSLTGEVSESFFKELISLEQLDISRNYDMVFNVSSQWIPPILMSSITVDSVFVGTEFPLCLQTQTKIGGLSMSNASISGAIPDHCLTVFPNLVYFDVSNNSLTGSIPTFHSASLYYLKLSGNQFSGIIPTHLCNITALQFLFLANNQLTGRIPSCFGSLKYLTLLDMGNNSLSGHIPSEFGSFNPRLEEIHLNENFFSGQLPASMQNLTALVNLDLGNNEFQGSIPQWIGKNWSRFRYLRLQSNNFSGGIPISFYQLPSLHILNLAYNGLVGTIPPCFGNLSSMLSDEDEDDISWLHEQALSNIFKGREMKYTSNLIYAKFLSLSGNHLHGEIPAELMNLKGLESLDLSNNELIGMIPETINNLKHMESLDLSMNRLSGTIPQSLADIDALGYLNLSFNRLAGRIPSGNHLDTLDDPSIYEGNGELCGKLLKKSCPGDDSATFNQPNGPGIVDADEEFEFLWLCAGIGPGFAVGFLTVVFILYFKHPWRTAYFGFVDNVYNKVM